MKKIIVLLASLSLAPAVSWGWSFGSGGSVDYSRDIGSSFYCTSTGTVATQAGVSLSSPTISLYNPTNSGKYLTVLEISPVFIVSPAAAASFELAFNVAPSSGPRAGATGSALSLPAMIGVSTTTLTAKGQCVLQGILPATPTVFRLLSHTTGASAIGGVNAADQTQGKIVIPPGGTLSLHTTSAAQAQASILWREDNL